jgi:hypothetical protein
MANDIMIIIGGILPILWGIAHIVVTKNVVKDFGEISEDNKNIITMEWVYEGLTMIFIGSLVVLLTVTFGSAEEVVRAVYLICVGMLLVMAIWSLFTGFKVDFIPFKLCPVIFTGSAVLIVLGVMV